MSIAVFRSDYVTFCAASTSVRFDRKAARNRQLHIFAERFIDEWQLAPSIWNAVRHFVAQVS